MTAICAGGAASQPKADSPLFVQLGLTAITAMLSAARLQKLAGAASFVPIEIIDTSALCTVDPPAWPTFGIDEIARLINPVTAAEFALTGKFQDLIKRLAWYQLCECTTGAAPTFTVPPVTLPPGEIEIYNGTPGLCVAAKRSEVKVLSLWNGTTNVAPPSGYGTWNFNDSAWVTPPAPPAGGGFPAGGGKYGLLPLCVDQAAGCVPEGVAPWSTCTTPKATWLLRWKFFLPEFDVNSLCFTVQYIDSAGSGWSTGGHTINDTTGFVALNDLTWKSQILNFKPGWNLFTTHFNSGNTTPVDTWGARSYVLLSASIAGSLTGGGGQSGCCPPDPSMLLMIQRIWQNLQLIQRQAVPFEYVAGPVNATLSGDGTFALSGGLGLWVEVTTLPSYVGIESGEPDAIFDAGYISVGTASGYQDTRRIDQISKLWFPPAMGAMELVGYSLSPGVVIRVTELLREP